MKADSSVNVLLCGVCGVMGRKVVEAAAGFKNLKVSVGIDRTACSIDGVTVETEFSKITKPVDVILDFSHHTAIESVLAHAVRTKTPLVIAATGHTPEQLKLIEKESKKIPIFKSTNFSICVNRFIETVAQFAKTWKGDIEIVETHHNRKADAPSGTAITLADAIIKSRGFGKRVPGRTPQSGKREPGDIGISAVRGGVVAGEHEVRFYDEISEVHMKEREYGRESFAIGALHACEFVVGKPAGRLYNMSDLLNK